MNSLGRKLDEMLPERSAQGRCRGKIIYRNHTEANRMSRYLRRQGVRGLELYRCQACQAWHLGNGAKSKGKGRGGR